MIDHFERLARHQREQRRGKQLAALAALLIAVAMMTAGGAMALAFLLAIAEGGA